MEPVEDTKYCKDCDTTKSLSEFGRDRNRADGMTFYCKACANARRKAWYRADPTKVRAANKAATKRHRERHPEMMAEYARRYRVRYPERTRAAQVRQDLRRCGLTPEGYDALVVQQEGKCAICGGTEANGAGRFHIDHDHRCCPTRRACDRCRRSLLCHHCNLLLGNAREGIETLRKAADYLARWG